jgi:hypothetical protein
MKASGGGGGGGEEVDMLTGSARLNTKLFPFVE